MTESVNPNYQRVHPDRALKAPVAAPGPSVVTSPGGWVAPAVAGLCGGVGLGLLVGFGGMPAKVAYALVAGVAVWACAVIWTRWRAAREAPAAAPEAEADNDDPIDDEG